jgi:lipopolysaccharide transport system ATP-binding protein
VDGCTPVPQNGKTLRGFDLNMSDTAIKVENLGKSYLVGHNNTQTERYTALRDVITHNAKNLARKTRDMIAGRQIVQGDEVEEFWALKDVNFEIKQGDRVGIIGRNGAGKSTLLKVLSRITEPTTGRVRINGRVASLLEVGTGFHPELTGRENIFLNGAILGMSRQEIQRKFDEIVEFAEVEKFLDTPVKRYSSGMYVRLAFAVAAHLEPEILIVDEVLAVGDAQFQKKCLGKMQNIGNEGRTVLFVSHNMDAIERLCDKIIVLENGNLQTISKNTKEIISNFLHGNKKIEGKGEWKKQKISNNNKYIEINYIRVIDEEKNTIHSPIAKGTSIEIEIRFEIDTLDPSLNIGLSLINSSGITIYWSCHTDLTEEEWPILSKGQNKISTKIPSHILNEGEYKIEILASLHNRSWIIEPGNNSYIVYFTISGGLSNSPFWYSARPGLLAPSIAWKNQEYLGGNG